MFVLFHYFFISWFSKRFPHAVAYRHLRCYFVSWHYQDEDEAPVSILWPHLMHMTSLPDAMTMVMDRTLV